MSGILIVLPCRIGSSRLFEKHRIILGNGKTLMQMTYEQCLKSNADRVVIAVDDPALESQARQFTDDVMLTEVSHRSGSERVAEVSRKLPQYKYVVNVQGDEPCIKPDTINRVVGELQKCADSVFVSTAKTPFLSWNALQQPSQVKVVTDVNNNALLFSRSVIPYHSHVNGLEDILNGYYKHVGIYAYTQQFLQQYIKLPITELEQRESLEQLRILEHGYKIRVVEVAETDGIGVDTSADLESLENHIKEIINV